MQLKRLALTQVRGFERAEFTFQPGMNVLVGVNGAGKSTVLDSLRILLSQLLPKFTPSRSRADEFEKSDIRVGRGALTAELWFAVDDVEFNYLVHIPREEYRDDPERAGEVRDRTYELVERHELKAEADGKSIAGIYRKSDSPALQAVYFSTRRSQPDGSAPSLASSRRGASAAYSEALSHRGLRVREFAEWWLVQEALGAETGRSRFGRRMEALNDAICRFLEGCSNVRAVREPEVTLLIDKADGPLDVHQLSDGERGILSLVLDLARRLALANPELADPLREGEAVVLIDELDLHLHPGWQRKVVGRLVETFPRCQFIATTHSPQIIGQVESSRLQILLQENGSTVVWQPQRSFGLDANRVLEELMDVKSRDGDVEEQLQQIFQLIDEDDFDRARDSIATLEERLGPNDPEITRARSLIAFLEEME